MARPQERNIVQIIRHPNYRPPSQYHDIALLRLDWSVTFDEYVRPACLPTTPVLPSSVTAAGWGVTDWCKYFLQDCYEIPISKFPHFPLLLPEEKNVYVTQA